MMKREDIRLKTEEEKKAVYDQLHQQYLQGNVPTVKQHSSGFPAVTIDCESLHYLTDCLSLEEWWALKKKDGEDH